MKINRDLKKALPGIAVKKGVEIIKEVLSKSDEKVSLKEKLKNIAMAKGSEIIKEIFPKSQGKTKPKKKEAEFVEIKYKKEK
jgi:hypothetical protein